MIIYIVGLGYLAWRRWMLVLGNEKQTLLYDRLDLYDAMYERRCM